MEKELLEYIRDDLKELKKDVKVLLQYKNYSLGIVAGITLVISIGVNIFLN